MRQSSISIRDLRGFTSQRVLERLSSRPVVYLSSLSFFFPSLTSKCLPILFQHFQRDIVRGVEGYIVTGSKQVEIGDWWHCCITCWCFTMSYIVSHCSSIYMLYFQQEQSCQRTAGNMVLIIHVPVVIHYQKLH